MKILVTGSSGLIGSEVCSYFSNRGYEIHGIDNNQRAIFFGPQGDTSWPQGTTGHPALFQSPRIGYSESMQGPRTHKRLQPNAIVHTAAQPSHDKAASFLLMISMSMQWARSIF